jgi:monoamine oxidase
MSEDDRHQQGSLNYAVKQAMRPLDYGPSAKVGIMFSRAWWMTDLNDKVTLGGLAHSDLSIRICVYPSYNLASGAEIHVLLCTYTWQQDAERIGSLMCSTVDPNTLNHKQILQDEANLKNSSSGTLHACTP